MSRSVYINRSDSSGPRGGKLRRALAIILVLVLLAVALVLLFVKRQNDAADGILSRFEEALEAGEYNDVLDIHTLAQERSLSKSQSEKNREIYSEAVLEMEDVLFGRIDDIIESLQSTSSSALTDEDIAYLSGLEEFSASKLSELISSMGLQVMAGELSASQARSILAKLANIEVVADEAAAMRGELAALESASEPYQRAMALFDNENYLAAAISLDEALDTPEVINDSLAGELFASELVRVRQTMRPILIAQIEELMERNKFITAERQMDGLLRFFPDDNDVIALYEAIRQQVPTDLVQYSGNLEHITIRPLIANTAVGLGDSAVAQTADSTMLTTTEFKNILNELHLANYILIDIETMLDDAGAFQPIMLPAGKKPLLLTLEGFNYYPARKLSGNVENLVIDDNGNVAGVYTNASGQKVTERESEAIGILDAFIDEHPDFSFDGAKGTITLTGNMGVFGYVYTEEQLFLRNQQAAAFSLPSELMTEEDFISQKNQAKLVIDTLKADGWTFGTQTFSGTEVSAMTQEQLEVDYERWVEEVGSLTGSVQVLAYPNGAILSGDDARKTYLQSQGIRYFLGIGPTPYAIASTNYLYMDRLYMGGYALRNNLTARLFESAKVYDPARRIPLQ